MPRANLILREKVVDEEGNIFELVIWSVPATAQNASGVRYRLAFIRNGEKVPRVLYDNHSPKGHHRHMEGVEEVYAFTNIDRLLADFVADVRRIGGHDRWPRR